MNVKKLYAITRFWLHRNDYILCNKTMPTSKNVVNLHWWDSSTEETWGDFKYNLGDNLSTIIVSYMLQRRGLSLETKVRNTAHLYAVGSILQYGYQNATVWGSGILRNLYRRERLFQTYPLRRLDIRAVRGPLTKDYLVKLGHKCPEVYGDPAILMPLIYQPTDNLHMKTDFVVIPHFSKNSFYVKEYGEEHIVSMITDDYKNVLDRIYNARLVISGSLHGIILAETYGVPSVFLRDRAADRDFKYSDYYQSTLRNNYIYASTVEDAMKIDPMSLPSNLDDMRDGLIKTFPYDLWNS
ncbi:MAG: exopolysaccharide biosynthesis pyruvyl transferase ExoV [bacterium F082]|nr:MAG: exopolysaccharide biosynthesis pyruvyl transferase ExoV [bacterium F082]KWW31131.1 MAG: exopolysaccharide biosynthesis pyruvyl transferase ExoV [bacterium P201]